jgi:AmmeMemoRadiSam system protein A
MAILCAGARESEPDRILTRSEVPGVTASVEPTDGTALARLAAAVVGARLAERPVPDGVPQRPALTAPGASFVTLEAAGRLRGCIGTIEAARPLYLDVIRNAQRAMCDPRMPPVVAAEWPDLDVKVAVLTAGGSLPAADRDELIAALRPGIDGILIADGQRRATFLPAVWAKLPEPARFVAALLVKGGWPETDWPAGLVASRYTTVEYRDPAPRPAL